DEGPESSPPKGKRKRPRRSLRVPVDEVPRRSASAEVPLPSSEPPAGPRADSDVPQPGLDVGAVSALAPLPSDLVASTPASDRPARARASEGTSAPPAPNSGMPASGRYSSAPPSGDVVVRGTVTISDVPAPLLHEARRADSDGPELTVDSMPPEGLMA